MRETLDHLDSKYQRELEQAVQILHEEFDREISTKLSEKKRSGRILKIILFGSFAQDTWVDDRMWGYKSDFDILIIVNKDMFTDIDYWHLAYDRLEADRCINREVNFIVHSLQFVNDALAHSKYFFVDIYRQGVMVYEAKSSRRLKKPAPLNAAEALEEAEEHYEEWSTSANEFFQGFHFYQEKLMRKRAAFLLHQTVESLYHGFLLVRTNYSPNSHNINHLRSLCNGHDAGFSLLFPDADKFQRRAFSRLKDAYVKARYSKHYVITDEELTWLSERAVLLTKHVEAACGAHIETLREATG